MQKEIIKSCKLLDDSGNLNVKGYAKHNLIQYNKEKIAASKLRIKEWDYYYVGNEDYGLALTIDDNGYMGMLSVSLLNFKEKSQITKSDIVWFTMGSVNLPNTSKIGDVSLESKNGFLEFKNDGLERKLSGYYKNFTPNGEDIKFDLTLSNEPDESITILTPFEKDAHFYYNQKINCMEAKGQIFVGGKVIKLNPSVTSGTLDWGRGVWTYKNTWYWGSLSTVIDKKRFGFNIGYGFGDTSAASENVIFYDGKVHKFENIDFGIPKKNGKDDFMSTWHFKSSDGRLDMTFIPILDRFADTNVILIRSCQHQVFGRFSGVAILDDGSRIEFKDKLGFAEKVFNKW